MTTQRTIDAVDLSIMWNRLISITDEGAAALVRTSFSTLVREGYDLTVLIFDAAGRMIAQRQVHPGLHWHRADDLVTHAAQVPRRHTRSRRRRDLERSDVRYRTHV